MPGRMRDPVGRTAGRPVARPLRAIRTLAAVSLLLLAPGACGDEEPDAPPATVRMGEFWYRPADVTVPRDGKVSVVNDGRVVHTWIVQGAGVGTTDIRPGRSVVLDLEGIPPGTYSVYCDQPGHAEAGQGGRITIA